MLFRSMRLNLFLFPLEFYILAAYSHWREIMLALTYNTHTFVNKMTVGDAPEGRRKSDIDNSISGWSTLMTTSVDFYLPLIDLQGIT